MKYRTLALAASLLAVNALAQTAAAPAAANVAKAAEPAASTHACTKPELPDGKGKISEARMKVFVAGLEGYKDCISLFAQNQQMAAEKQQKAAQASIASANSAIKEYNDFVEEANKITTPKDETKVIRHENDASKYVVEPRGLGPTK